MNFGIDFGTSNCAVALWEDDTTRVIPFDSANVDADWYGFGSELVFPSVYGTDATSQQAMFGWNAKLRSVHQVEAVKRLLAGHQTVQIGPRSYPASHVATLLFRAIKSGMGTAGLDVAEAVVTVPAKSTGQARYRTREAAHRAGIKALSLINEPTAAAMAYVDRVRTEGTYLVYDWGGGTIDATVLEYRDGVLEERAASGRAALGGIDIDEILRARLASRLRGSSDWAPHERRAFALDVERAKISLSVDEQVLLMSPRGDSTATLDRAEFEDLVRPLVAQTLEPVREVLEDLGLDPLGLDAVIMVGGSSRIPLARRLLAEACEQEPVDALLINPLTAVAEGAAFAAAALRNQTDDLPSFVTANALGTRVQGEHGATFSEIIPRNSPLPFRGTRLYKPKHEFMSKIRVDVWEGDPDRTLSDPFNQRLKQLEIPLGERLPAEEAVFSMEFTYSNEGTVSLKVILIRSDRVVFDGPIDIFEDDESQEFVELPHDVAEVPPRPARAPVAPKPGPSASRTLISPLRKPAARTSQVVLVVDGSNLAWEGNQGGAEPRPSVQTLFVALDELLEDFPAADIKVVVDANFRHLVSDDERPAVDEALRTNKLIQPPAGTQGAGDALLLKLADKVGATVVSNDSYREFQEEYPWLRSGDRLIGARRSGANWIFLKRTPPAPRSDSTKRAAPAAKTSPAAVPETWKTSGWAAQTDFSKPSRKVGVTFGPVSDNYYMSPLDSK
ncbi:hypothetical protein GCM10011331_06430 [Flavimobilis marinus]|uniref:Molecular chaperone DnaK (HSP70) n=1 Tax=Flavimobilis marinus TaxID=285351 RepID=A0A1I2D158_9MICO|nr:Hsp70 family protein [Flavimobilis marinus]GHG46409.1 hypothetical protein GCM10011331_06430 [Flavimobilis marinus]SFE74241.1 Molecular chaperone DnaK (HSP70) [Flavimobilis marinus]